MSTVVATGGLLAEYQTPAQIFSACEQVRDAGYTKWDACTPFPVHGLERAMGLPPSKVPWVVLAAGLLGGSLALLAIIWIAVVDSPLNIGGKPLMSIPAFIPVIFECTILLAGVSTFLSIFFFSGLPRHHHPLFASARFARATDDRFFLHIEPDDPKFDVTATKTFLETSGASVVEVLAP